MSKLQSLFSTEYLLAVPETSKYEAYFLYLSLLVVVVALVLKIYFVLKKRSKAFQSFDRLWFWGYLTIGFLGLFVWFSRNQQLPMLGARIISYFWFNTIWLYGLFLLYYYKKHAKRMATAHYEKARKEKYLK